MSYYNKIGMLILNQDQTKFLVCEKAPENVTSDFIMPGGKFEEENYIECLKAEIKEELNCEIDISTIEYVGQYTDIAAGRPDKEVTITLYKGEIIGVPIPSTEIRRIHWIGAHDRKNNSVSPIIRNKIIPDLISKNILKVTNFGFSIS